MQPVLQLSLSQAEVAINAAMVEAEALNINESIAVTNADGHLVAFRRMDCAIAAGVPGSIGKAVAAAIFAQNTDALETKMGAGPWVSPPGTSAAPLPIPTLPGVAWAWGPAPIYAQGAIPIIINGVCYGAVGCGGGTGLQDEQCAQAGVNAVIGSTAAGTVAF